MRRAACVLYMLWATYTHTYTGRETDRHPHWHSTVYVAHTRCCLKYGGKFTLLLSCCSRRYSSPVFPLPLLPSSHSFSALFSAALSQRPLHGCFTVGFLLFFLEIAVKNNKAPREFLALPSPAPSPSLLRCLPSFFRFLSTCLVFFKFCSPSVLLLLSFSYCLS